MGRVPAWLLRHEVTVESYEGEGGAGPIYGPPRTIRCFITVGRREVLNGEGRIQLSERGFICGPDEGVKPGDRATIRGDASIVIAVGTYDGGGLPTPDNLDVACE